MELEKLKLIQLKTFFSNKMNLIVLNELEKILSINNAIIKRKNGLLK